MKCLFWLFGLFLMLPFCSVQAQSPELWLQKEFRLFRVYPRLDRAQRLYSQGRYTEARRLLEQATTIDATYVQAWQLLVESCNRLNDFMCKESAARHLLALPAGSSFGAYYLMQEAARKNNDEDIIYWGELALTLINGQLDDSQRSEIFNALRIAYESTVEESGQWQAVIWEDELPPAVGSTISSNSNSVNPLLVPITLETYLANSDSHPDIPLEQLMLWINILTDTEDYEDALTVARQLPDVSASKTIQVNLLEKLSRYSEAANLLMTQATEEERRQSDYWLQLFNLYELAGLRNEQVNVLFEAHAVQAMDSGLLSQASILLLAEANRLPLMTDLTEGSVAELDGLREMLQRLLALIDNAQASGLSDDYRAYRTDAEINLARLYLESGDEDFAWTLVSRLVQGESVSFSQASALAELMWGMSRCQTFITDTGSDPAALNFAASLLLSSCQRRLGNNLAASTELENLLEQPNVDGVDRRQIQRGLGYLYMELGRPEQTLVLWQEVLTEDFDAVLTLGAIYAAIVAEQWGSAEQLMLLLEPGMLPTEYLGQFWQMRGNIASHAFNYEEAEQHYTQALVWDKSNPDIWRQLANAAELAADITAAQYAWEQLLVLSAEPGSRHAEFAYFLRRNNQLEAAVLQFEVAISYLSDNLNLRRDLVYTLLSLGQYSAAATQLREEITVSQKGQSDLARYAEDQVLLDSIERSWSVEISEIARINKGLQQVINPALRNSSYRGYGSLVVNYLPEYGRDKANSQRLILGARLFWSNPDQSLSANSESTVLGLGARYKLLSDYALFGSIEHLAGIGSAAEDDTLLRISASFSEGLAWPFGVQNWNYENLYLDAAYFVDSKVHYGTIEYERGNLERMGDTSSSFGLMPFLRLGATANNDNQKQSHETRVDAGVGLSLMGRHIEDDFLGFRANSRMSFLINRKLAGNTEDNYSVHFRINTRL